MSTNSIPEINLARLKNEVHVQFHETILSLINKKGAANLPFEKMVTPYKKAFDYETEALLIIMKSETTAKISEQDRVRDSIYRGFSDTVKGFRNHFKADMRNAANLLWSLFDHYGNICIKTLDAETAAINDFLREFSRPEIKDAAAKLNVLDWTASLNQENFTFQELMMERYSEATLTTTSRMKTSRLETDKYYRAIVANVNNQILMGDTYKAFDDFVVELRVIVARFKNILAQEMGRKNSLSDK